MANSDYERHLRIFKNNIWDGYKYIVSRRTESTTYVLISVNDIALCNKWL